MLCFKEMIKEASPPLDQVKMQKNGVADVLE